MAEYYTFDCGCKFKILGNKGGELPLLDYSGKIEDTPLDCSRTWSLISDGNTKGCFQLESRLGQTTAKKLKPNDISQLSALIAIIRPGCLESIRDGKNVTSHFIDKKNGIEEVDFYHEALTQILYKTFGEMIYQEQAMQIAQAIAGFNLQEADSLRKAIGKKNAEGMEKIKKPFIEGAIKTGLVKQNEAEEIFGWIQKSQRYSFNASHSVSYAFNAYLCAYAKAHFPKIFFASYLKFAKDKMDSHKEIKELVRNAMEMDIVVANPDLRLMNREFLLKDKIIYFGLTDIKDVGDSVFKKLEKLVEKYEIAKLNWVELLQNILLKINSKAAKALISSGALDYTRKNRTEMLFEFDLLSQLTDKELTLFDRAVASNNALNITQYLEMILATNQVTKRRVPTIESLIESRKNPAYSLVDKIEWLSDSENALLGVALSCSKLDCYDISMTNTNCKDFKNSVNSKNIIIAGEVSHVGLTKTKNGKEPGKEMAFVTIEDSTGILESIILFPETYAKYRDHLYIGNILGFIGNRSKAKDSLIVEKCFMPST